MTELEGLGTQVLTMASTIKAGDVSAGGGNAKPSSTMKVRNVTRGVEIAGRIELAGQSGQRRKGLLGRTGLDPDEGLWILPCEAVHTFFMRFAIDLVYLDRNRRVRKVRSQVPPWRLSGCLSAHSVLELAPGTVERTQTRPGDSLEFSAADPLEGTETAIQHNSGSSSKT